MRSLLRRIAVAAAALLCVLLGLGWLVAGTGAGARWTLHRVVPAEARISGVEGRLVGPLRVGSIEYRSPNGVVEASARDVELTWAPLDLLSGSVTVRRLSVGRVRVMSGAPLLQGFQRIPRPEPVLTGLERLLGRPIRPPLPLALHLDTLRLDSSVVISPDFPRPVHVGEIDLGGRAHRGGVEVSRLKVSGRSVTASATGLFRPDDPGPGEIRLQLEAALRIPGRPAVSGRLDVRGTTEQLDVRLTSAEPVRSRLQGRIRGLSRDAKWSLHWATGRVRLPDSAGAFGAEEAAASMTAAGTLETAAATLAAWTTATGGPEFTAHVRARLVGDSVVIDDAEAHQLGEGAAVQASGGVTATAGTPRFSLVGGWRGLVWPLRGEPVAESPSGDFRVAGEPDSVHVTVSARASEQQLGSARVDADALVRTDSTVVRRLTVRPGGSSGVIEARGTAYPTVDPPGLRAAARWRDLSWPLDSGPPIARSPSGRLTLDGTARSADFRVDALLESSAVDSVRLAAGGRFRPSQLAVRDLRVDALGGRILGSGHVALPHGPWSVDLRARHLSPDLSGAPPFAEDARVSVWLRASGLRRPDAVTGSVHLDSIVGEARNRNLGGFAHLTLGEDSISADSVRLHVGTARLTASGVVGESWALTSRLEAPALVDLHPEMTGTARADLSVSGARRDPKFRADVAADSLAFETGRGRARIGDLAADATWRPLTDELPDLDAAARGVVAGGVQLDSLSTRLSSAEGDTRTALRAAMPAGRLVVAAGGRREGAGWTGHLDSLTFTSPVHGSWQLRAPATVRATRDSLGIGRLCWGRGSAALCGTGTWSRTSGARWEVRGDSLSADLAEPWMPSAVDLSGDVQLSTSGSIDTAGAVHASAEVGSGPLTIAALSPSDTIMRTAASATLRASLTPDSASTDVDLSFVDGGYLNARVRGSRTATGLGTVDGGLQVEFDDDGLLGAVLPDLASTAGRLSGDVEFSGEWPRPSLRGSLGLVDGRADVVPQGLSLRELNLRLSDAGPGTVRLEGHARSGPGSATVEGTARLTGTESPPSVDLRLQGEDLEVQNTAAVRLLVSPDLILSGDASGLAATGRVRIPEARIAPRAIEAPVRSSPDVVVVDRPVAAARDTSRGRIPSPPIRVDLDVELGDRVRVEGFGLSGRLSGGVRVSARPGEIPTGRGEIRIIQGRYLAFQRSLRIDQGRLIFTGGPVDDPGLDLRITRRTAGVEVGMTVGGSARSPRFVLFSTPAMSETDLLSYLLFGRPVAGVSRFEGSVLRDAVQGIGLIGGEALAAQLGSTFGLDESRLVTEGGRVTALDLGTSLSPRLTLGYTIGLFGAPNLLRIGYRIGGGWVVRAESGAGGGADVLYVIER